jgi:pimeloyl-ACP methyl ester carboxylesterase
MKARLPSERKLFSSASPGGFASRHDVSELHVQGEDCQIRTLVAGSGPPVLLIHGLLGYSFSWRYNLDALAENHTVYAVDLPGFGFSERVAGLDVSLPASARRLLGLMEEAGVGSPCDVIASSHGGALAILAAAIAPERLGRLVLCAPVNPWSAHGKLLTRVVGNALGAACFRAIRPALQRLHNYFVGQMYGDARRITPGTCEGYAEHLEVPGTIDHVLSVAKCWASDLEEVEAALPRIGDKPVLLLWGDLDRAVYPNSAQELLCRLPNARLHVFRGVGHLPYEEVPQEFNRVVLEFLA